MQKCITLDVTNTLIQVSGSVGFQYSQILKKNFNYNLNQDLANHNFKKYFIQQNKNLPGYGFKSGFKLFCIYNFCIIYGSLFVFGQILKWLRIRKWIWCFLEVNWQLFNYLTTNSLVLKIK